jgi:arylsulfatase A-like enzyme
MKFTAFLFLASLYALHSSAVAAEPQPPNIVLIMADDMGFSDLGCYGSTIATPNLDTLANNGIRYNRFYNAARCCPTRAALLTGLYPHQTGLGWMTAADLGSKGYTGDLNDECRTIAECLKDAGYSTYMSGKWHVSRKESSWPLQRGFDRFYGIISGGANYWHPNLTLDNKPVEPGEDYYLTEGITKYANQFLHEHFDNSADKPFFLYLAHYAPHIPLHARPEDIARYRGKFKKGWDVLREEKYRRMLEMGIVDPSVKLSEKTAQVKDWGKLDPKRQEAMELRMAIYAAMIDSMDRGIGEVIGTLKKHHAFENTLILFLSDNGGEQSFAGRDDMNITAYGTQNSRLGYGPSWATYSNTPFRYFKKYAHEGGISSPLIAHWPNGIQPQEKINTQVGHVTDLMPTVLELAGASYQPKEGEKTFPDLVGQSLVPTFTATSYQRAPIIWEHNGNRALRDGKWKLVAQGINGKWELYDIGADRSETRNLASQHPDIVKRMAAEWDAIAKATDVYPLDGRGWGEKIKDPLRKKRVSNIR